MSSTPRDRSEVGRRREHRGLDIPFPGRSAGTPYKDRATEMLNMLGPTPPSSLSDGLQFGMPSGTRRMADSPFTSNSTQSTHSSTSSGLYATPSAPRGSAMLVSGTASRLSGTAGTSTRLAPPSPDRPGQSPVQPFPSRTITAGAAQQQGGRELHQFLSQANTHAKDISVTTW